MLFLVHTSPFAANPAGTEFHVLDLVHNLRFPRAIIAFPEGNFLVAAEILSGAIDRPILYRFRLPSQSRQFALHEPTIERLLRRLIRILGVVAAHVHHLMYWPVAAGRVLREAGLPFAYTAHDYFAVCPNWNMFDARRAAVCPCDQSAECGDSCLPAFFEDRASQAPIGFESLVQYRDLHRAEFRATLAAARLVVFPSNKAREQTERAIHLDEGRTKVIEHGYAHVAVERAPLDVPSAGSRALRLFVLGEVGVAVKGSAAYLTLVERTRDLPVEWHFIGDTPKSVLKKALDARAAGDHAVFHGRIERAQLFETISRIAPDLAVLMPACHETFSYVLSELMIAGLPVLVNELGAVAERVRAHGAGWVVGSVDDAVQKIAELVRAPDLLRPVAEHLRGLRHMSLEEDSEAHRRAYVDAGLLANMGQTLGVDPLAIADLALHWEIPAADTTSREGKQLSPGMPPVPAYQKQFWYPQFVKIKRFIPASLLRYGRDALLRYQYRTWRVLHVDRQAKSSGVRLLKRGLNETTWVVRGRDPQFVFALNPVPARTVRLIRFRMLQELECEATAQIFWTHSPDAAFDETRSARVALDGRAGEWHEYLLNLDSPMVGPLWRAGELIYRLRFVPIDSPGVFSVGPIEMGG
jgi:glycosyltransferase involved in cell wall biosynthesis